MPKPSAVVVLSGGMDSATALWHTLNEGPVIEAVSFDYGQRHRTELGYAATLAEAAAVAHRTIRVPLGDLAPGSALTGGADVPHGHYEQESMAATVVPNRNMVFTALAVSRAQALGAAQVVLGVHDGDHAVYADCRAEFIRSIDGTVQLATDGQVGVVAPFVTWSKADIAHRGHSLGVPFNLTWSCYEGGDVHCGRCGTCVERAEAFDVAAVPDPTAYADPDYWRAQVTA